MIIDKVISEDFAGVGVMTSPSDFSCLFENSSLGVREPSGGPPPSSPHSDCDSSIHWTNTTCQIQTCNCLNPVNGQINMGSVRRLCYQGVRVKNPVKELIMQKRDGFVSWGSDYRSEQALQHSDDYVGQPVLSTVKDVTKRAADHILSPSTCPKKSASLYNNVLTPCSYGTSEEEFPTSEQCFTSTALQTGESVAITTAQVQEIPPQAFAPYSTLPFQDAPHCSTLPPQAFAPCSILPPQTGTPSESSAPHLHPTTDAQALYPGNLPKTQENIFSFEPLTLQPDPPSPSVPHLPLSFDTPRGVSFFQWQIEQEEKKLTGLAPDLLVAGDSDGDTFLHIAVAQGRRALSYVLAKRMAFIGMLDIKERNAQSALQVSVAANQHLIVQDLLSLGAQINTVDCWGRSPLHICAEKGHILTLQAIHRTLQTTGQHLNMEAVNYDGLTALHTAVSSHNAVVQELGGMASHSPRKQTLVQRRKLLGECVCILLHMGASYKTMDRKSGRTALHMAAEEANVELLRLFLDQPDSLSMVNAKAYDGNTALHVVSALQGRVGQVDAVKLLMRRGADPSTKNLEKDQPVQLVPEGPVGDQIRRILKGKESRPGLIHSKPQTVSVQNHCQ